MFVNENLQQHLETSSSINSQPLVIAEWNMNVAENIQTIGNYRHRPTATSSDDDFVFAQPLNTFDINDANNDVKFYAGATDADVLVDGGLDNDDQPIAFIQSNQKERLLFSLEECFRRFRPRSGINKLRYFEDNYTHFVNRDLANRPRYYMASRNDSFRYWTSYRKEDGVERGIANIPVGNLHYIDDAAPFITYKENIPANRIVVKMQTNVGDVDLGPFLNNGTNLDDPFYGDANKTVPNTWKIQVLKNNNWEDAVAFNPLSTRTDGSPIVGSDGYVEIAYGLIMPEHYSSIHFVGKYTFASLLPISPEINSAYFVQENDNELGSVYVWNGSEYESFVPQYGWFVNDETLSEQTRFVTEFVNPEYFVDSVTGQTKYKEFEYLRGIRVVATTMNKVNATFDLLELSPRLTTNITERVSSFNFNKSASDLGVSGMPVGQLLAANGSLEVFDFDDAFNKNNVDSILSSFTSNNLQVKMFEIIYDFSSGIIESYHIPLKTMYADGFPESSSNTRKFSLELRDLFFYFESLNAPQILVENASLSYAVSFLLDSIGFTNYTFKRVNEEDDPTIPYFFVKPETSVAEVLQELAVATQTAMFFDEYNNLVMMSKNYMMPSTEERETDLELLGSVDQTKDGVQENISTKTKLSNIVELSSKNQEVFNDGKVNFQEKYIAKTYGSLKEASYLNQDQNWIYKPALLWEVAGTAPLRSIEASQDTTSTYTLAAVPLNSDLSDVEPYVSNNQLQNNILDFGEGGYWVARYNGYFYANGEIIKYDAIEHNVSGMGNVWISSLREYQNYFSQIQFGGKIYPTGRVRIYAEPFYEDINGIVIMQNGAVRKNGRAQFGTSIAYHSAGLSQYWSDTSVNAPVRGIEMDSTYLFSTFNDSQVSGVYNQPVLDIETTITIEEPGALSAVAYGDGQWVGVGTDGQFRISADGETWQTVIDEDFDETVTFNSVAFGIGPSSTTRWIAVGEQTVDDETSAVMAYSEDGESWTEISLSLSFTRILKIAFENNVWVIVGNNAGIATSSDGNSWTEKTARLDYTIFGDNKSKVLSDTLQETGIRASRLQIVDGDIGVFTRNNHRLQENDRIRLTTDGILPTELNTTTDYYVSRRSANTFTLKLSEGGGPINVTSPGSGIHRYTKLAATFTISRHGLSDNEPIRIVADGTLPDGISENTTYYVRIVDQDKIHLSESEGGTLIDFTSTQSDSLHKVERFVDTTINSVAYGNGKWVVVAQNGCLSYSTDLNSWTAVDAKFDSSNIFDIYYGNSVWVAVGASGKVRKSTDLSYWERVNVKLKNAIRSVHYADSVWLVGGNNGEMSRSTNLSSWKKVNANFGTSRIDQIVWQNSWLAVGNKLQVSKSADGITWSDASQENVGELVFETSIPHGFTSFDQIVLSTSGNLPTDAEKDITSITVADPAVFTYNNHKLETDNVIKLSTTDTLPGGLEANTEYYVQVIDKNTFSVRLTVDGNLIETTSTGAGTHSFFRPALNTDATYYVTPKNLSEYAFTVANSRYNARNGVTVYSSGVQDGTHTVSLNTFPDYLDIDSISADDDGYALVTLSIPSDLGVGERVFFGVRSGTDFVEKRISGGLVRYAPFYIHTVISETKFLVSETLAGDPKLHTGEAVELDSGEVFVAIFNLTEDILNSTLISPSGFNLSIGNLLQISDGAGELVSPTRISATRFAATITKPIAFISIGSPAIIESEAHGLFDMDIVTFSTTGTLPYGIDTGLKYYVQKVDDDYFFLLSEDFIAVETKSGTIPDTEDEQYRTQSGTHSFNKSFNDTNKIILTRAVAEPITQYSVSEEEILVDAEDGETSTQTYYDDVSYENVVDIIQELEIDKNNKAGVSDVNNSLARSATRNGIIKNYLTKSSFSETDVNKFLSTQTGTIQSSALVFDGPSFDFEAGDTAKLPLDFLTYAYKPLESRFSHFGTRMRIIGRISQEEKEQILYNSLNYFLNPEASLDEQFSIYGGSGGLGVMVNPSTNVGYYFEIMALSQSNVAEYSDSAGMFNVVFYKVVRKVANDGEDVTTDASKAIPIKLWQGVTNIVADDGTMVGQFRMANEDSPSVYDLSVEYEDIDENNRKFYLMINNKVIAVVDDNDPLPVYNNMALFVRGGTRAMFENVYAIANNYSQNTVFELDPPVNTVFGTDKIDVSQSFRKYALSGSVQSSYLSGISSVDIPKYNIYFEEFGTVMREVAYFNIRYDKAYPALYAKISDTFNKMKGYTVSGFVPSAYGAEFLVFNNTDTALNLDETSGNYLRIQGVTFTQSAEKQLTVDDYFERISNFADPDITEDGTIISPVRAKQDYLDIKNSRITYGRKEFNISSSYIQSEDEANDMMAWIISKIMKPRKSIGLKIFGMPTIQLGDIVSIDYQSNDGIEQISSEDSRFVVYNIEYSRGSEGPSMNVFLSEVL